VAPKKLPPEGSFLVLVGRSGAMNPALQTCWTYRGLIRSKRRGTPAFRRCGLVSCGEFGEGSAVLASRLRGVLFGVSFSMGRPKTYTPLRN
jgi:hypothetical protein